MESHPTPQLWRQESGKRLSHCFAQKRTLSTLGTSSTRKVLVEKMRKSGYGPSDSLRFCKIPANITSITPDSIADPRLGRGKIGEVQVNCRFLHEKSKWGRLEHKNGTVSAGIIHMEITFRNLHKCVLESANIRVSLEGEHHILEKYRKIAHKITGLKRMASPVEVKQVGPVSLVGTPFGVSSKSLLAFDPTVEFGGVSGRVGAATLERESTKHTRWVFEGSASPGKQSGGATVNTVEWTLDENVPEGQPSHGNCFRTAFVFTNDGQPFILKVEVEGSLRKVHHQATETVKRVLKIGGSRRDAVTTLICGFENEKDRLNKFANRVVDDMNRANGALDYHRRRDGQSHDPEPPDVYERDKGEKGVQQEVDANYAEDKDEEIGVIKPKTRLELAKMMAQSNTAHIHGEGTTSNGKVKQPAVEAVVEPLAKGGRRSDEEIKQAAVETVGEPLTREEAETVALVQILLLLWQEVLGRIQKLLALG